MNNTTPAQKCVEYCNNHILFIALGGTSLMLMVVVIGVGFYEGTEMGRVE